MDIALKIIAVLLLFLIAFFLMAIWRAILGHTDTLGKVGIVTKSVDTKLGKLDTTIQQNNGKLDDNSRAIKEHIRKLQDESGKRDN